MLRTLFTVGLIALVGLFALKLVFGLLGPLVSLLLWLSWVALKVVFVGALVYGVVRVVSPTTAKRITDGIGRR